MKIYNTLTRSVDEFKPLQPRSVKLYTCGPTVYDNLTIGNWAAYVRWDVLARTLRREYDLKWYMNITDVGHLTSDEDSGEDKMEKGARREGKSAWQIAEHYSNEFINGLKTLNIDFNTKNLVKATDHIKEQIALIEQLEKRGFTYKIEDGVYFDSTKFPDYGRLGKLDIAGLQAGARIDVGQKKNPTDFALWKLTQKGQKRDMEWESPWGKGFPGWHIECSAMAMKYLGNTIDIHAGGIDHIAVHHTNEIAQSEAATGQTFANYWVHSNFLKIDGTKIAKSLNNGISLADIDNKGYTGKDLRMFILQSHYRSEANFTREGLSAARERLRGLQKIADYRFQPTKDGTDISAELRECREHIREALENDLNTPRALFEISRLVSQLESTGISAVAALNYTKFLEYLDQALGFNLLESSDITTAQTDLIQERNAARANKDWKRSDQIRESLAEQGLELIDTDKVSLWSRTKKII